MGTVRGNMGSALEHVVLSVVAQWVVEQDGEGPLLYVDTHAMAPLNKPTGRDFNLLADRLRNSDTTIDAGGASVYAEVFGRKWLPQKSEWYPTHFVHAARVANRRSCAVTALLFENDAADALPLGHLENEDRRAEITRFLGDDSAQQDVGVSDFHGTLRGDFRDAAEWPGPSTDGANRNDTDPVPRWRALVVMSDPLEYRPESAPGGSRLGCSDLTLLRERLDASFSVQPDLCAHVVFVSANLGTWGSDASNAAKATEHISDAWRKGFAPKGAATWCGACCWGGFLVFVGVARRSSPPSFADGCSKLHQGIMSALPSLYRSGRGKPPRWIAG